MPDILTPEFLTLMVAGFFIGIFAVVIGGGMFFSAPLAQWLFPQASFGVIVGNLKVGAFFRSIGSIAATWRKIAYKECFKLSAVGLAGTVIGASFIAHLDQRWLFPAIVAAVVFAIAAPKIAAKISNRGFYVTSFLTGLYTGFFGAGNGIMLIALLRLKHPADTDISYVKIQARFIEFLFIIVAVTTHFLHGNLVAAIWIPWSIGNIAGGYAGGILLHHMGKLPGRTQKHILYTAFTFAIVTAGIKFLNS